MSKQDMLAEQYKNDANLNARIQLHTRFSTNMYPWFRWVFDHFDVPATARILEIGCGPADLWVQNLDRLPAGWEVTLVDFSPGMIEAARRNLATTGRTFAFEIADAQALPFDTATFDAVIADHMLYHVPDLPKAVSEIHRVLEPGGALYAATNGAGHLRELWALIDPFVPGSFERAARVASGFTLENGAAVLVPPFAHVARHEYPDALEITAVEPLIAYIRSSNTLAGVDFAAEHTFALRAQVAAHIAAHGAYHVGKSTGLFVAK